MHSRAISRAECDQVNIQESWKYDRGRNYHGSGAGGGYCYLCENEQSKGCPFIAWEVSLALRGKQIALVTQLVL